MSGSASPKPRLRVTPLLLAVLLVLIAAVAAWQVTIIPVSLIQMAVGP